MRIVEHGTYKEDPELRARLQVYSPDEPGVVFPFTARLARENGWSREHARRVTAEYLRFVYLAVTAGHPVTPSQVVDEAWHLHLTYTRSYWEEMCGRVLGRPLHHEPTRGGADEDARFADWYARTLASYREAFGQEPPTDVWPRPVSSEWPAPSVEGTVPRDPPQQDTLGEWALSSVGVLIAMVVGTLGAAAGMDGGMAFFVALVSGGAGYMAARMHAGARRDSTVPRAMNAAPARTKPAPYPAAGSGDGEGLFTAFVGDGDSGGHSHDGGGSHHGCSAGHDGGGSHHGCGGHSGCGGHGGCGSHGCGSGH